ncbi:MAG: DNA/RNA non-specific endonuclease [Chitinophagales bacterium]|nr:DNA/RNA non-specific endonuclease [Chitinophagales bacterium]
MQYNGYQHTFIDPTQQKLHVVFPQLNQSQLQDLAPAGNDEGTLNYIHYSLKLSASRKFPFFTASNIDGSKFIRVKRAEVFDSGRDEWKVDDRAKPFQWGQELYSAPKSYFDRGHLTKREDPQWGPNYHFARQAAQATFYFSNCTPQVAELNQRIWQNLETYILSKQTVKSKLRICLFTGPVLSDNDPTFVTPVKGQNIKLPVLFWKVIYYTNDGKKLSRTAFLMGQENLLIQRGIAYYPDIARTIKAAPLTDYFMDFEDAETFQVNIKTIETLSGLTFPEAAEPYKDNRPLKLITESVQASKRKLLLSPDADTGLAAPDFEITNLKL